MDYFHFRPSHLRSGAILCVFSPVQYGFESSSESRTPFTLTCDHTDKYYFFQNF